VLRLLLGPGQAQPVLRAAQRCQQVCIIHVAPGQLRAAAAAGLRPQQQLLLLLILAAWKFRAEAQGGQQVLVAHKLAAVGRGCDKGGG
jgi:hypothetical protein